MAQLAKRNTNVSQTNKDKKVEEKEKTIEAVQGKIEPIIEGSNDDLVLRQDDMFDLTEIPTITEDNVDGKLDSIYEENYSQLEQENNKNLLKLQAQEKELAILKQELADKDKKLNDMTNNFSNLQSQIDFLMKQSNHNPVSEDKSFINDTVKVGCRAIYGAVLATNDGRYVYSFGCDEEKDIAIEDLKILFRESFRNNKRLFEEDTFYFVNPEDYKNFGIKKMVDLSRDNLLRILTLDKIQMIDEVNKMTNHLINFPVTHALQFEVVKLLIDKSNPLKGWDYENRVVLENYIGQKFDDLMAAVGALELLGRKKFS